MAQTYYTDEEIDALVNDVKQAFLAPAYQLAKSEGKQYPVAKEGGNGVQTKPENGLSDETGPRADTMKAGQPSKSGKGTPSLMSKAAPPSESPESDSAPAESSPDASASSAPAPDASSAPAEGAPAPDASMGPDAGGGAGGPEQQNGPDELKAAYESLDDQSLQMHLQIAAGVLKERMGAQQGAAPGGAPAPDAGAAPAPDMGAPAPAPEQPPAGGPPGMSKGEELSKAELAKAQVEISKLSKGLQEMTEMFIKLTNQPKPKAITEFSELTKSETAPKLTKESVDNKLLSKSRESNLLKSDRNLIIRYFTPNSKVKFEEIEHLLK